MYRREISMKLNNIKKCVVVTVIGVIGVYIPMEAASYVRNKQVTYETGNIYYNGTPKNLGQMPIMVDGVTYLPARGFVEMLGLQIDKNNANKNLYINSNNGNDSTFSIQAQLDAKEYEIAALKHEINTLKLQNTTNLTPLGEYDQTSGNDILGTELTETMVYLDDTYNDYFDDIDFEYKLYVSGGKLKVDIYYDRESEDDEYYDLHTSDKKRFVEKICKVIRDRHDDITIEGTIIYEGYRDLDRYKFTYSRQDKMYYNHYSNLSEEDVLDEIKSIDNVEIDGYDSKISIKDKDVDIDHDLDRVEVDIELDMSDYQIEKWNDDLGTNSDYELKSSLKDICNKIYDATYYDIEIDVYQKGENDIIAAYDSDGDLVKYKF